MLWINYYFACRLHPGPIPVGWDPSLLPPSSMIELKLSTASPRYCRNCSCFKPPRSHHCSSCNRCILKMDHHCPWINNCVGFRNQPYFIRFLFYVDIATIISVSTLSYYVYEQIYAPYPYWLYNDVAFVRMIMAIIDLILSIPVLFIVGGLSLYHFWYVSTNLTTIEAMEKDNKTLLRRADGYIGNLQNPYRHGVLFNLTSVFGPNPFLWFLPIGFPPGDGTIFPINQYAHWEYLQEPVISSQKSDHSQNPSHIRRESEGHHVNLSTHPYAGYYAQQSYHSDHPSKKISRQNEQNQVKYRQSTSNNNSEWSSPSYYSSDSSTGSKESFNFSEDTDMDDDLPLIETQKRVQARRAMLIDTETKKIE